MTILLRQKSRPALFYRCLTAVAVLTIAGAANPQQLFRTGIADYPDGTAGLGVGVHLGTDNYSGEELDWDQVPLFLYEGKRAFAQGNTFGYRLLNGDSFSFAPLVRGRVQSVDASDIPELQGLNDRRNTIEAGLTATLKTRLGELQLTGVDDVLDHHGGSEIDLTYRLPLRRDRWTVTPWVSLIWQDDSLTGYYYGITDAESSPATPAYTPEAARNVVYGINSTFALSNRVHLFANVGIERIDATVSDSPIVESSTNAQALLGAAWIFGGESPASFSKDEPSRPPVWSWRVHWAYQLRHNIFPLPLGGGLTPSRITPETVPTQFGLTLSRLLRTSERINLYARAAVFRHREEPFQDDFNSYNFSMTALLKSYSNYSDKVAFRWGLGFGLSYVEEYPGQEVQLLVNYTFRDQSKLLAYMEAQWDFALDKIIKTKALEGCFFGILITHRSGIFGGSTVTGGVRGGSDWGGLHLECSM